MTETGKDDGGHITADSENLLRSRNP
jgi:hypothetical protein